jgi:SAM-dependent methyltransferase
LAHGYRTLQHWDHWLAQQFLGQELLEVEKQVLARLLSAHFGKHALLIGVSYQQVLLPTTTLSYQTLLTPLIHLPINQGKNIHLIEGDLKELPLLTGSVDLVMLPHTLEFIDNPRQLLAEACRVIKPEGLIVITGFNPFSLWGLKKIGLHYKKTTPAMTPWGLNFIRSTKIKHWLALADFKMEKQTSALFRPPVTHAAAYKKLRFMEQMGKLCFPACGGVYFLLARAKVRPLTPIKLKWKQQLSSISISTTISGNIARQSDIFHSDSR